MQLKKKKKKTDFVTDFVSRLAYIHNSQNLGVNAMFYHGFCEIWKFSRNLKDFANYNKPWYQLRQSSYLEQFRTIFRILGGVNILF